MWHVFPVPGVLEIPLRGPRGEPVDFARTIASHGVAELPPNELSLEERTLVTTLPVGSSARTVRLTSADRKLRLEVVAGRVGARGRETLNATVSDMFRLDEDLSAFYELVSDDPGSTGAYWALEECCARRPSLRTSSDELNADTNLLATCSCGQRARDLWLVRHLDTTVAKRIRTTCSLKLNR